MASHDNQMPKWTNTGYRHSYIYRRVVLWEGTEGGEAVLKAGEDRFEIPVHGIVYSLINAMDDVKEDYDTNMLIREMYCTSSYVHIAKCACTYTHTHSLKISSQRCTHLITWARCLLLRVVNSFAKYLVFDINSNFCTWAFMFGLRNFWLDFVCVCVHIQTYVHMQKYS